MRSNKSKQRVLIYGGLHKGNGFAKRCRGYDSAYGFEANPELHELCQQRFAGLPHVRIIHGALSDRSGTVSFNVSSNEGLSSSLGTFRTTWQSHIQLTRQIQVPALNLCDFIHDEGIQTITDYVSDLQGSDLTVLKTLAEHIDQKRIGTIQCEVAKNERTNIYAGVGSNRESDFEQLLRPNYLRVATGWGSCYAGVFETIPDDWWEFDAKWVLDTVAQRRRLTAMRLSGAGRSLAWLRSQQRRARTRRDARRAA